MTGDNNTVMKWNVTWKYNNNVKIYFFRRGFWNIKLYNGMKMNCKWKYEWFCFDFEDNLITRLTQFIHVIIWFIIYSFYSSHIDHIGADVQVHTSSSAVSSWDEVTVTVHSLSRLPAGLSPLYHRGKGWRKPLCMLFGGVFPGGECQGENCLSTCLKLVVESWETPKPIFREERERSERQYLWWLAHINHSVEFWRDLNQKFAVLSQSQ